MPIAVGGEGPYLIDSDGKRYMDASGGAAVSCLGHGDPEVIAAIREQAEKLAFAHTGFFTTEAAEELAETLISGAPDGIGWVYFVSGGSEAVEAALKMARQYFVVTGEAERRHVISRRQSYHGNTLGALSVGGHSRRREPYLPVLGPAHHISPCYAYRGMGMGENAGESEQDYGLRVADELEAKILELGPETVSAFIAETVVGATLGAVPPVAGYFRRIREICDKYGVLLILDEVMCGTGRTGTMHACEADGVAPDLMCLAKGLGGGYQPIGAVLVSGGIHQAFRNSPGGFEHGHTYMGHPVACAAALAVQRAIVSRGLLENAVIQGEALSAALHERFGNHHNIGDIRGRGLFLGLEIVADRATREPFEATLGVHARLKKAAFSHGLICYPDGGCADGLSGDHVLLAPPFIIDSGGVSEIVDKLGTAFDEVMAGLAV